MPTNVTAMVQSLTSATARVVTLGTTAKVSVASSLATTVLNGNGSPVDLEIPVRAGQLFINNLDSTLWAVAAGEWKQLV
jgi:vacuolar-type H+-ATPase subunit B/Vma2